MATTVLFFWHTDREFVITRPYSTSCRVFTISKVSLFPGASTFTSLHSGSYIVYTYTCDGDLFSHESSLMFLLKSWFVIKDGKLLPCPRDRLLFLTERHLWITISINRDSWTFIFYVMNFWKFAKCLYCFETPVVRFWNDMLHMDRLTSGSEPLMVF